MLPAAILPALWASLSFLHSVEAAPVKVLLTEGTTPDNATVASNTTLGPLFNTTMFAPGTEPGMYSSNFSRLVMFGDSLSDNGNGSRVLSNGTTPDPRIYWNYRWSNGPIWVEDLAERLNITLVDYAVGGATVNNTRTPAFLNGTVLTPIPSALEQIETFVKRANSSLGHNTLEDTLFAIWIGANDIISTLENPAAVNGAEIVDDIFVGVEMLKAVGAKHILLNTMPDIGRTPLSVLVGSDAAALLTRNCVSYRNALFSAIDAQSFAAQNVTSVNVTTESTAVPSAQFAVVDAFLGMDVIFRQPEAYGFAEETLNVNCARGFSSTEKLFSIPQGICADPDSHFFWDLLHPTRVVHSLFAQIAASSLLKTGWISRR